MSFEPVPIVGDWYQNSIGDLFEVIAQDDEDDTLELQYYDGTVEELDPEAWRSMNPESIEPPEDWSGSMDVSREDSQSPEVWEETTDWMSELDRLDQGLD